MFFGDPARTERIRLRLDFGVNGYEVELGYGANDQLFFARERCTFQGDWKGDHAEFLGAGGANVVSGCS